GGEVFTTLDLRQAYNQLPLDEEAKKITVLNTQKGLFCFNRLPFGVSSAPAIFQRRMDGLLGDIPGVQVYLDDIIIAEKKHDSSRLKAVLQRLREYGLRLNKGKCKFRQDEVTFLGHRIDAKGLRPKDDNIKAVVEAPKPTSQVELLTNRDTSLLQVKKWISQGWPSYLPQGHEHLQPYFNRRTTPVKEGKSPAELLLGYQIRTKLDCIAPDERSPEIQPRVGGSPVQAGDPVWMRDFRTSRRRWIPGVVRDQLGSRMVTLDSGKGIQRRHLDQVRRRTVSDSFSTQRVAVNPADSTPITSRHSPEVAQTDSPPPLRRSTRQRRPPERLDL
ncbi:uncharacterized protein LOC142588654, partial [Dermacentor variabilis]|uniref:uncharacterized protein LOC142588654 n=1 Tax=Dermacentor variabilis TaxID=34621 RepID=UPI003F5AE722